MHLCVDSSYYTYAYTSETFYLWFSYLNSLLIFLIYYILE